MSCRNFARTVLVAVLWLGGAGAARACSVCFGAAGADNPDAAGLNAGIAVLFLALVVIQVSVGKLFLRLLRSPCADQENPP